MLFFSGGVLFKRSSFPSQVLLVLLAAV
jgi:hypothetical protein